MKPLFFLVLIAFTFGWPLRWGLINAPLTAPIAWAFGYTAMAIFVFKWRAANAGAIKSAVTALTCCLFAFLAVYGVGRFIATLTA